METVQNRIFSRLRRDKNPHHLDMIQIGGSCLLRIFDRRGLLSRYLLIQCTNVDCMFLSFQMSLSYYLLIMSPVSQQRCSPTPPFPILVRSAPSRFARRFLAWCVDSPSRFARLCFLSWCVDFFVALRATLFPILVRRLFPNLARGDACNGNIDFNCLCPKLCA